MIGMAFFLACASEVATITLSGTVTDAPEAVGAAVAGATVAVFDETLAPFGETVSGTDGAFALDIPALATFYVQVDGEGRVPTAFSGTAGLGDLDAGQGYPWVADADFVEEQRAAHGACGTAGGGGAVVLGVTRVYLPSTALGELPIAATADVAVLGSDAQRILACSLDDAGVSAPDATTTGATGRFAVFGVPAGPAIVGVSWVDPGGDRVTHEFQFLVPADGLVPLYPALVGDLP
jgi:hypothetical protein